MKVKIGDSVKNIPKRFSNGVSLIKESQLEAPHKIRLTPFERFLFAEAAWRKQSIDSFTLKYLNKLLPTNASIQINRKRDRRYVVHYQGDEGINAMAIVPKNVYNRCPNELRTKEYFEF